MVRYVPMISYIDTVEGIAAEQIQGFFVGWPSSPSPATHLRILAGSAAIMLARDDANGAVVGFITSISLYMIDLICDTDVRPFYARLGMQPYTSMILRNYDRQSGAQ